jgi:ParB/RepB/Spo0J family partition protein
MGVATDRGYKLKIVKLSDIKVNGRYRDDMGDLQGLADAIKEKGVLQPITLDTDLNLLAGGRRHAASTLAGLVEIPALIRTTDGELDAREVELMENVNRKEMTWQEEARLTAEINRLYEEKHAKTRDWSGRKTAELLDQSPSRAARNIKLARAMEAVPELANCKTADEALKTIKSIEEQAITAELRSRQQERLSERDAQPDSGNLTDAERVARGIKSALKVAEANYIIGDTFVGMKGMRTNGHIDFIECDPPYGVNLNKQKSKLNSSVTNEKLQEDYNEIPAADYPDFLKRLCTELYRVAGKDCWMIFWFGQSWQHEVLTQLREAGWEVDEIPGIWVKSNGQTLQPELYLARVWEPFYICRKGNPVLSQRGMNNAFLFPGCPSTGEDKKYHPTQRPVVLINKLLFTFLTPGSHVFVPFLGSGATLRSCYYMGYPGFGYDNNGSYKDKFMLAVEEDARRELARKKGE